jgi:hypothetical protein
MRLQAQWWPGRVWPGAVQAQLLVLGQVGLGQVPCKLYRLESWQCNSLSVGQQAWYGEAQVYMAASCCAPLRLPGEESKSLWVLCGVRCPLAHSGAADTIQQLLC